MDFFHKGGGVPSRSKSFGALFCSPLFPLILVKYDTKVPQKFKKKISPLKIAPKEKFQKSGGGSDLFGKNP